MRRGTALHTIGWVCPSQNSPKVPASQDTPSCGGTAIDQQKTQHAARSPILKQALLGQMLHLLAFPAAGEPRLAALRQTLSLPHG
jgi:hypothetical protein